MAPVSALAFCHSKSLVVVGSSHGGVQLYSLGARGALHYRYAIEAHGSPIQAFALRAHPARASLATAAVSGCGSVAEVTAATAAASISGAPHATQQVAEPMATAREVAVSAVASVVSPACEVAPPMAADTNWTALESIVNDDDEFAASATSVTPQAASTPAPATESAVGVAAPATESAVCSARGATDASEPPSGKAGTAAADGEVIFLSSPEATTLPGNMPVVAPYAGARPVPVPPVVVAPPPPKPAPPSDDLLLSVAEVTDGDWYDLHGSLCAYDLSSQMAVPLSAPLEEPLSCIASEAPFAQRSGASNTAAGGRLFLGTTQGTVLVAYLVPEMARIHGARARGSTRGGGGTRGPYAVSSVRSAASVSSTLGMAYGGDGPDEDEDEPRSLELRAVQKEYDGHSAPVSALCHCATRGILCSGATDGSVCIWALAARDVQGASTRLLGRLYPPTPVGSVVSLTTLLPAAGSAPRVIVAGTAGHVFEFDLRGGRVCRAIRNAPGGASAFVLDARAEGHSAWVACGGGELQLWRWPQIMAPEEGLAAAQDDALHVEQRASFAEPVDPALLSARGRFPEGQASPSQQQPAHANDSPALECAACRAPLVPGVRFCGQCGAKVATSSLPSQRSHLAASDGGGTGHASDVSLPAAVPSAPLPVFTSITDALKPFGGLPPPAPASAISPHAQDARVNSPDRLDGRARFDGRPGAPNRIEEFDAITTPRDEVRTDVVTAAPGHVRARVCVRAHVCARGARLWLLSWMVVCSCDAGCDGCGRGSFGHDVRRRCRRLSRRREQRHQRGAAWHLF